MTEETAIRHPATFSPEILDVIDELLGDARWVLDPFAGIGGIHELCEDLGAVGHQYGRYTFGVEIEKEWADQHIRTVHGSALALPWGASAFDAIATSPTYGNRMADSYDGRDGSARSTYRIALGEPLNPENSGRMQWGKKYRALHRKAWAEAVRVLKPGGRFVLNCKDHVRKGEVQRVTDWHAGALRDLGLKTEAWRCVETKGYGYGANAAARVGAEDVVLLRKPKR